MYLATGAIISISIRRSLALRDRIDFMGNQGQICRLTYTGDLNSWDFAIYKYSKNRYDPNEWFFPGSGYFDGTVEGAMKAGLEAYPP